MQSYWQRKLTRRRVLATGAGGSGLLALTVVGCGGDDSGSNVAGQASRLSQPTDTSSAAKRGGIYQGVIGNDETTFDPLATSRGGGSGGPATPGYSRMLAEKVGIGAVPKTQEFVGDLAESWELAKDALTLTMKLRPDAKFDARPPTNGRTVTADDVVFSLNKFFTQSPYASSMSYQTDPAAAVESVRKIDDRTVQYKMAYPWSPLLATFANGTHLIMPTEADGKFNPKTDIRGSSAWLLQEYISSSVFKWRRNPELVWQRLPLPRGLRHTDSDGIRDSGRPIPGQEHLGYGYHDPQGH